VEQSHQPDKAFVTVCAMLNASTRIVVSGTNRAKPFGRGFTGYAYVNPVPAILEDLIEAGLE